MATSSPRARARARHYRVIAPDLRGDGETEKPAGGDDKLMNKLLTTLNGGETGAGQAPWRKFAGRKSKAVELLANVLQHV